MSLNNLATTPEACRKFLRRTLHLDQPHASVGEAIRYHGFIQIDPIDVCGKMHDLILRNRVQNYQRDGLLQALYQTPQREFFEHYVSVLVALPIEDYRYVLTSMKRRRTADGYSGALNEEEKRMARQIIARIRAEGPLSSLAFTDSGNSQTGWGTNGTLAKTTLDKLFFHGRLLITRRDNFRRVFDLPERILPAEILKARPATALQAKRWHILTKLKQRRLVILSSAQVTLVKNAVTQVKLTGQPPLYCLKEDADLLSSAQQLPEPDATPLFLAPLDPVIYDRKVTRRIWDFDYTWEVYTPPTKRVRGYYALPVLAGEHIVGHIDPKADRKTGILHTKVAVEKGVKVSAPLKQFTRFLDIRSVKLLE